MKMPFRRRSPPSDTTSSHQHIRLERVGRSRIEDLVSSTRRVPWVYTFGQLLWTAGPVTFLALQGGHWLGYGTPVGMGMYVFFAIYIVLTALIGIIAKISAEAIRGEKQSRARANITRTIDILPDMIFTLRDLNMAGMSVPRRQRESAATLLEKVDLGPASVALAVEELSGDSALGRIAEQIEVYRRVGMFSRIQDLVARNEDHVEAVITQVRTTDPETAKLLSNRLHGIAPSQEHGVARGENFIGHIFSAAQQEDLSLMSLPDAEDLITLTFELLSGREITRLIIGYEGDWQLARTLDELENRHNEYRQTKASAVLHLRDLALLLTSSGLTSLQRDALDQSAEALLNETSSALNTLAQQIRSGHADIHTANPRTLSMLRRAHRYARLTRTAIERLEDRYLQYARALERWNTLREQRLHSDHLSPSRYERGLRIRESTIALTDEQKLELAAGFCRYLDDLQITIAATGVQQHDEPLAPDDAKRLAIRIALLLRPLVGLDNPSVQRALETSRAAYLEGLEMGFSADAKAGLGSAVVKEVRQHLGPATELIALRLTQLYRMPLPDSAIEFLCDQYGANRERLTFIADSFDRSDRSGAPAIPHEPSMIRTYAEWRTPIQSAEALLARLTR